MAPTVDHLPDLASSKALAIGSPRLFIATSIALHFAARDSLSAFENLNKERYSARRVPKMHVTVQIRTLLP